MIVILLQVAQGYSMRRKERKKEEFGVTNGFHHRQQQTIAAIVSGQHVDRTSQLNIPATAPGPGSLNSGRPDVNQKGQSSSSALQKNSSSLCNP